MQRRGVGVAVPSAVGGVEAASDIVARALIGAGIGVQQQRPSSGLRHAEGIGLLGGATEVEDAEQLLALVAGAVEGEDVVIRVIGLGPLETSGVAFERIERR